MIIVFTNGCFDLLHPGHVRFLQRCKAFGDKLVVGLNSDKSISALKGNSRPLVSECYRREMLLALRCVDQVLVFDSESPLDLIKAVRPDVLIKGMRSAQPIIGSEFVSSYGGLVVPLLEVEGVAEWSTTELVRKIQCQS